MFSVAIHEGRLIEIRVATPLEMPEFDALAHRLRDLIAKAHTLVVLCSDWTHVHVFPPEVADALVTLMKTDNPRVERSAFLVGESATAALQAERMIRTAGNPARRSFHDPVELSRWLGETLTVRERVRLERFLREPLATNAL